MKEVDSINANQEQQTKNTENIQINDTKEDKLDTNLNSIILQIYKIDNLSKLYETHPVLYDIIVNNRYKPAYRLPLLRAITNIENEDNRNSLINSLIKILDNMTITDELKKIISELNLIKNSEVGKVKYGGKIRFNRKRKSSKRKSSKKKQNK
jgi:hypothetical protein